MKSILPSGFVDSVIRKEEGRCVIMSGNIFDIAPVRTTIFETMEELLRMSAASFGFFIEFSAACGARVMEIFADEKGNRKMRDGADIFIKIVCSQEELEATQEIAQETREYIPIGVPKDSLDFLKTIHEYIETRELTGSSEKERKESRRKQRIFLLVKYAESIIPGNEMMPSHDERALVALIKDIARSPKIKEFGHVICFMTKYADDLDKSLLDRDLGISQVRIGKPDLESRLEFIQTLLPEEKENAEIAAKITAGLSLRMIREIIQNANGSDVIQNIFGAKRQILTEDYGSIAKVLDPKWGFECVGGLEKQIAMLRKIAQYMRIGRWDVVPQGILFTGPPGTGKTVCAEALAKAAQVNIVSMGQIRDMYVGNTERFLQRFIDMCKDMAPVIVFVDEGDNAFGHRGDYDGSGGVEKRFLQKILEVMSDSSLRGKILWVSATNRPELMDAALLRPGRFSLRIPFLYPAAPERAGIFRAIFNKYPEIKTDIADFAEFADLTEGRNGADIESILVELAWPHVNDNGRNVMNREDVLWAIDDFIPQGLQKKEINKMIAASINTCHSKSLLPEAIRDSGSVKRSAPRGEVLMIDMEPNQE